MKFTKISVFVILPFIFIFLTLQVLNAAEFKQKLFLTEVEYPFFNNPMFQRQFSHASIGSFLENTIDIQKQTDAVILDYKIAMKVSSSAKIQMRNMLVGREPRKIMLVMGYGVPQNFIQSYLEINTGSFTEIIQDEHNLLFATGLYNTGTQAKGQLYK
jgi:hypothetical protein